MTRRDRRAILLGAVVVTVAVTVFRGGPATARFLSQVGEEVAALAQLLIRGRAELQSLGVLRDSISELEELASLAPSSLLPAGTPDEAVVEVLRQARTVLANVRGSVEFLPPQPDTVARRGLGRVTVGLRLETDVQGLAGAIAAIEGDSILAVVSIRIDVVNPSARVDEPEALTVSLEADAWFLTGLGSES